MCITWAYVLLDVFKLAVIVKIRIEYIDKYVHGVCNS